MNKSAEISCEKCAGTCCIQPPQIENKEELLFAISKNVKILAVQHPGSKERVFLSIEKKDKKCPFLENDNCSIYEKRFKTCQRFECQALGRTMDEIIQEDGVENFFLSFTKEKEHKDIGDISFLKKDIDKINLNLEIISIEESMDRISACSVEDFLFFFTKTINKLS